MTARHKATLPLSSQPHASGLLGEQEIESMERTSFKKFVRDALLGGERFTRSQVEQGILKWIGKDMATWIEETTREKARLAAIDKDRRFMIGEMFDALDTDRSGTIDAKEFSDLRLACPQLNLSASRLREMFQEVDEDRNGVLDFYEFATLVDRYRLLEHSEHSKERALTTLFQNAFSTSRSYLIEEETRVVW